MQTDTNATTTPQNNDEIANAFDALARFFRDNPNVKAPNRPTIHVFLDTSDEMSSFISTNPDFKTSISGDWFNAKKEFGSVTLTYGIKAVRVGAFEDREVVTTKSVWVPSDLALAIKE